MPNRSLRRHFLTAALTAALTPTLAATTVNASEYGNRFAQGTFSYEVSITNLTKGQVFSPPVLVTHSNRVNLFAPGEPASDELAILAEDGDPQPLIDLVSTLRAVHDAQAATGPVLPGQTETYEVEARPGFRRLSIVSMLVNTNDAFLAVDSTQVPLAFWPAKEVYALGYDAGSEANNELCTHVPGPACPPGSGNARAADDAEGYVYVHNGVHGEADLSPAAYDWRNPVARVSIRRVY